MGNTLKDTGNIDEAIKAYDKAILLKPDYAEAYSNKGNALQVQGNFEESIEAYNKALADARAEAAKIVESTKAEMKSELDAAIANADAEISKKSAESEKLIAEIRASALESVEEVAKATTEALVTALGGNEDDKAIAAAVSQEMKG